MWACETRETKQISATKKWIAAFEAVEKGFCVKVFEELKLDESIDKFELSSL